MKTRILLIMTLLLAVATRSMAITTDYGFYVGGVPITSSNYTDIIGAIKKEDSSRITVGSGGSITYNITSKRLTLKNVTITRTGKQNRGITNDTNTGLTVVFEGTVKLDAQDASPILCRTKTTLKCANGGKVILYSTKSDGLTANGCTIYIQEADMDITGDTSANTYNDGSGIMSDDHNGTVEIYNSQVKVNIYKTAVYNMRSLKIGGASKVVLYGGPYKTVNNVDALTLDADMVFKSPEGAHFDSSKKTVVSDNYPEGCHWTVSFSTTALEVNATNFPDENFRTCVSNDVDENADGYLTLTELNDCKTLNLQSKGIQNLKGIEHFTQLELLNCSYNQLEGFNITKCTALITLCCNNNKLTSLTVPNYKALTTLDCYNNDQLTSLNVSGCTALTTLNCYGTQIGTLNVSNCTALTTLNCYDNRLQTSLYVSGCTALKILKCNKNQLKQLNASGCTALTTLDCSNNKLSSLNASNCTALTTLDCQYNQLTSLNVSGCTALKTLNCYGTQIGTLNVSSCKALTTLNCQNNQLTTLDVSSCSQLQELHCYNNALTSLTVANNPQYLRKVYCHNNKLSVDAFRTLLSQKIGYTSGCEIRVYDHTSDTEQNRFNSSLLVLANSNNWKPYYYDSYSWHSDWQDFDEHFIVTGIDAVTAQEEVTEGNAPRYNLQGQRVGQNYRGVVILNGRKVLVK